MILIACVDERMGMAFNRRRQSRDKAVYADIAAANTRIWLSPRSSMLFEGFDADICADEDFAQKAFSGEFCFVEFAPPAKFESRVEKIILYHWNRSYPADTKFDIPLDSWLLESTVEFPGSSHEKITKEVYTRE